MTDSSNAVPIFTHVMARVVVVNAAEVVVDTVIYIFIWHVSQHKWYFNLKKLK